MNARRQSTVLAYAALIAGALFFATPFLIMLSTSLRSIPDIVAHPMSIIPRVWMWSNYLNAVKAAPFALYFLNTFIYAIGAAVGTLFSAPLVAYSLTKVRWPLASVLFGIILGTMMIPFQATMVPLYILFYHLHWIGTFLPLIVPYFLGYGFYIFLMRQFMGRLPKELTESAVVDGAGDVRIFATIILPLVRPALATIGLLSFLAAWTDFLGPLLYLTNSQQWTLAIGLQQYEGAHAAEWTYLLAATTIFVTPVTVLFLFLQRAFVRGMATTGVRG